MRKGEDTPQLFLTSRYALCRISRTLIAVMTRKIWFLGSFDLASFSCLSLWSLSHLQDTSLITQKALNKDNIPSQSSPGFRNASVQVGNAAGARTAERCSISAERELPSRLGKPTSKAGSFHFSIFSLCVSSSKYSYIDDIFKMQKH